MTFDFFDDPEHLGSRRVVPLPVKPSAPRRIRAARQDERIIGIRFGLKGDFEFFHPTLCNSRPYFFAPGECPTRILKVQQGPNLEARIGDSGPDRVLCRKLDRLLGLYTLMRCVLHIEHRPCTVAIPLVRSLMTPQFPLYVRSTLDDFVGRGSTRRGGNNSQCDVPLDLGFQHLKVRRGGTSVVEYEGDYRQRGPYIDIAESVANSRRPSRRTAPVASCVGHESPAYRTD